jgi:hypothetical protein
LHIRAYNAFAGIAIVIAVVDLNSTPFNSGRGSGVHIWFRGVWFFQIVIIVGNIFFPSIVFVVSVVVVFIIVVSILILRVLWLGSRSGFRLGFG